MTTVILAEKPDQALAYASAFDHYEKKKGYYKIQDTIFHDQTFITYALGHLVELVPPEVYHAKWKNWSLDLLPVFPEEFKFQVNKKKEGQFYQVKKLLNEADTVILATDCGREGENIAWSIINQAINTTDGKTFKRLWINSQEKEVVLNGFRNLKNASDYLPFYKEAQTRQFSDWLIGMNASPLYSLCLKEKGVSEVFSVGRVQTPTLFMIHQREEEIEHFEKQIYYDLGCSALSSNGGFKAALYPTKHFESEASAVYYLKQNGISSTNQTGKIVNVETNEKATFSPQLFSLSSIQSKANQLFKVSANDTLNAVQFLYDSKFVTYPRTDCSYITENEFLYLKEFLEDYRALLDCSERPHQINPRKRYVENSKVTEHHAIIPTRQVPSEEQFSKFTELQKNVYMLILKTTYAMFLPDYRYEETIIDLQIGTVLFRAKGNKPVTYGWKQLFQTTEEKEELFPPVFLNEGVKCQLSLTEKETKPPLHYTEGALITAMKTAGKTVNEKEDQKILKEVEGIGTEATRAGIIETLKKKKYIVTKNNRLFVTSKGKVLCQAVKSQSLLTSAEMTAKWETYLKKIGQGTGSQKQFLDSIRSFVSQMIQTVPGEIKEMTFSYSNSSSQTGVIGKCPKCDGDIVKKKNFYGCSNYPSCDFTLTSDYRKKKLTQKNIKELIEGKETIVSKIKNTNGKEYNAVVRLNDKGYLEFVSFSK